MCGGSPCDEHEVPPPSRSHSKFRQVSLCAMFSLQNVCTPVSLDCERDRGVGGVRDKFHNRTDLSEFGRTGENLSLSALSLSCDVTSLMILILPWEIPRCPICKRLYAVTVTTRLLPTSLDCDVRFCTS